MTDRPVDAVADQYVDDYAALDPVTATFVGIGGYDDRLTDLSPDGFAAREALRRDALAAARAATPTDEREAVARDAFLERIGLEVELDEAGHRRDEFSVISSPVHELRQVFDLMPTDGEGAWAAIDARLGAVPDTVAGYRATLLHEADRGHVRARRQYAEVADQVRRWTGQQGGADFFTDLVARSGTEGALRDSLEQHAEAASAAYADFGRFVETDLAPRGREKDAVGREHYALASRWFLGAEVDLEETYAWGWEELARLHGDMVATAARILPDASLDEVVEHLDRDPARTISGREAFRDWMQQLADRTLAELGATHFDIPEPVRRIECRLAPTNDGGIYYTGPSEDFSRPGRMWWSVPDGIEDFHPWREVSTVFHEGVPGHHLQVGQTAYRSEVLNRWQRTLCWVSGHGEGWALYAERLMDELGHLDDPADRLGMLDQQSLRAARVVVDIGTHLELRIPDDNPFDFHPGETWDARLMREFLGDHARMDPAVTDFETLRYLGWPGQAPSYKVGERIWLQAREAARARAGDGFDLRTFHRQALDLGSLGLDPLRTALARL